MAKKKNNSKGGGKKGSKSVVSHNKSEMIKAVATVTEADKTLDNMRRPRTRNPQKL